MKDANAWVKNIAIKNPASMILFKIMCKMVDKLQTCIIDKKT